MAALQEKEFHVFIGHAVGLYGAHSLVDGFCSLGLKPRVKMTEMGRLVYTQVTAHF